MTPRAVRAAVEQIAREVKNEAEAYARGDELGVAIVTGIREAGAALDRPFVLGLDEAEFALLHLAADQRQMVEKVAIGALWSIRRARKRIRLEPVEGRALNPIQSQVGRKLLGWTQRDLAARSHVHVSDISLFERAGTMRSKVKTERIKAIRTALEEAGVEFTNEDEPGAKLRKSERDIA